LTRLRAAAAAGDAPPPPAPRDHSNEAVEAEVDRWTAKWSVTFETALSELDVTYQHMFRMDNLRGWLRSAILNDGKEFVAMKGQISDDAFCEKFLLSSNFSTMSLIATLKDIVREVNAREQAAQQFSPWQCALCGAENLPCDPLFASMRCSMCPEGIASGATNAGADVAGAAEAEAGAANGTSGDGDDADLAAQLAAAVAMSLLQNETQEEKSGDTPQGPLTSLPALAMPTTNRAFTEPPSASRHGSSLPLPWTRRGTGARTGSASVQTKATAIAAVVRTRRCASHHPSLPPPPRRNAAGGSWLPCCARTSRPAGWRGRRPRQPSPGSSGFCKHQISHLCPPPLLWQQHLSWLPTPVRLGVTITTPEPLHPRGWLSPCAPIKILYCSNVSRTSRLFCWLAGERGRNSLENLPVYRAHHHSDSHSLKCSQSLVTRVPQPPRASSLLRPGRAWRTMRVWPCGGTAFSRPTTTLTK
jgi:hypothetical protein